LHLTAVCLLLVLILPGPAVAGQVLASSAERVGDLYVLSVSAQIDAPLATVYRSITDFDNLAAINPAIEESRLLASDANSRRVRSVIKVCILVFCKRVVQVQDVHLLNDHVIEAVVVPAASDFISGIARWELTTQDAATVLVFTDQFEPDFWVPPLIGPWLIKRKLMREVAETAMYIELKYTNESK